MKFVPRKIQEPDACEHEWKTEIMMVEPSERTKQQKDMGLEYRGGRAAFKLRKCLQCQKVEYLDYKVERFTESV